MDDALLKGLPGEALFRSGRADLLAGRSTIGALLVAIARTRLGRTGFVSRDLPVRFATPELDLYHLLRREGGDAYSRYNALLRELASFTAALEHRAIRQSTLGQ